MSQVLRLSKEILQAQVVDRDGTLACIRAKGCTGIDDLWAMEIDPRTSGLPYYTELFEFIRAGYLTTVTAPGHIATLGIISRINPAAVKYEGATYSGIRESGHPAGTELYTYEVASQALTCHIIRTLAHELQVSVVQD